MLLEELPLPAAPFQGANRRGLCRLRTWELSFVTFQTQGGGRQEVPMELLMSAGLRGAMGFHQPFSYAMCHLAQTSILTLNSHLLPCNKLVLACQL